MPAKNFGKVHAYFMVVMVIALFCYTTSMSQEITDEEIACLQKPSALQEDTAPKPQVDKQAGGGCKPQERKHQAQDDGKGEN